MLTDWCLPDIFFDSSSSESMLSVTLGSNLFWTDHITSVAKLLHVTLAFFCGSNAYSRPLIILPYIYIISLSLEYGWHLWREPSKHLFSNLGAILRAFILVDLIGLSSKSFLWKPFDYLKASTVRSSYFLGHSRCN